ncbi:MAG: helicase-related protein, partial [Candidatus Nanopelagicales bacterium]
LLATASGEAGIVVGTHALLEDAVDFAELGLVVVDEQHRFGVEQRAVLGTPDRDGQRPHTLVMTATPIPRTVAMTVFGDLEVSVLDEYPPGRGVIATHVVAPREKPAHLARAWTRVREEVEAAPSDAEGPAMSSVLEVADELRDRYLSGLRIGILHGRMASEEKDEAMRRFTADSADEGAIDVLVATTVIEVGVDVPEASTMVILDA